MTAVSSEVQFWNKYLLPEVEVKLTEAGSTMLSSEPQFAKALAPTVVSPACCDRSMDVSEVQPMNVLEPIEASALPSRVTENSAEQLRNAKFPNVANEAGRTMPPASSGPSAVQPSKAFAAISVRRLSVPLLPKVTETSSAQLAKA